MDEFKITQVSDGFNIITESGKKVYLNGNPLCTCPVGMIVEFDKPVNPIELYGGDWEYFGQGRVLIGAGTGKDINNVSKTFSVKSNDDTIGEYEHTLTKEQMPSHDHIQNNQGYNYNGAWAMTSGLDGTGNKAGYALPNNSRADYITNGLTIISTWETGGSQSHNNIQPYKVVYRWHRIA